MRCFGRELARWAVLFSTALALAACGGGPKGLPISELEPVPTSVVRPGDIVQVEFWQQEALTGDRVVDRSGNIHLPLIGSVYVEGLDAYQIQGQLTSFYSQYYSDPLIVVTVRLGVNVTGEVRQPARYAVDPAFNVLDVLGLAGGLTYDAKEEEIQFNRGGQRYIIDLNEAQLADNPELLLLQSGDWIYVPRSFWTLQRTATYISLTSITISMIAIIVAISN
jgi:protein involved in polysaccharide export with SLBB domain